MSLNTPDSTVALMMPITTTDSLLATVLVCAVVLGAALPWRVRSCAFPIAAGDVFFETKVASVMSAAMINALPMWRQNCGLHAMKDLRDRLVTDPCAFILFPEGGRSRTGEMARFKPGLGMLVAGTDVAVYPAHVKGAFECWPPSRRLC